MQVLFKTPVIVSACHIVPKDANPEPELLEFFRSAPEKTIGTFASRGRAYILFTCSAKFSELIGNLPWDVSLGLFWRPANENASYGFRSKKLSI